ncbi:LysR family transcriptional regulator [uncultured Blautia sp.]|uniref:LysR family transcriptional regulator n=1 Tax=Blautia marasmi TaxID=1917868 RepID=UPI002594EB35|nr:LysR family transcriptional regulator [uncultured Blautia sp.]
MESLELRIFREVAIAGSLSKAAENMCYVQSNITAHIQKLEKELGTVLFVRHNKGITLTRSGEKLLSYANSILDLIDKAKYEFQQDTHGLHIGATQTLAAYKLPLWLSHYQKDFPDVNVSVLTENQEQLVELVSHQVVDCAFVEKKYVSEQLQSIFSFDEELCLIAPVQSDEKLLRNSPIITNKIPTCPYRRILLEWAALQSSEMPKIIEFDTIEAIVHSVSLGMGIWLLPYSTISNREEIAVFKPHNLKSLNINMVIQNGRRTENVYNFLKIISDFNTSE